MVLKKIQNLDILPCLLIVTAMGFFFKYYSGFGREWFNNYGAAIFYEMFWCLVAFWFFRRPAAVFWIPLWVFVITCILEFLQLWHPFFLEQFRATLIGKWLIGTTFAGWDFPHYILGCFLGWLWLRILDQRNYANKS
jgi:hypothetical protein